MVAVGREGCPELCAPGFRQDEQAAFKHVHMYIRLSHGLKGGKFPSQPGRNQEEGVLSLGLVIGGGGKGSGLSYLDLCHGVITGDHY